MEEGANRRFAISDIHGCARTFKRLCRHKLALQPGDTLYLLGDHINRGPDSKGVLDYMQKLQHKGINVRTLRGNHEDLLLQAVYNKHIRRRFLLNGGDKTLQSFGVSTIDAVPSSYIDYIHQMEYYLEVDDKILVHAGLNFSAANIFADRAAMLWIKEMTVDEAKLGDRYVIHGHTPQPKADIKQTFMQSPRPRLLNIDASCVYRKRVGARLCALNIDTWELTFSRNVDF